MIRTSLLGILSCSWCGEDFVSLGRHAWRCKSKLNRNNGGGEYVNFADDDTLPIVNSHTVECSCGKKCKGMRGLKMHQRSCRVLQGLTDNLLHDLEREITNSSADVPTTCEETQMDRSMQTEISMESYLQLGIKLPKTSWE